MIIITGKEEFKIEHSTAVAIGKFDGVHKGHRVLIDAIMESKRSGLKSVVFTFEPSPMAFFGHEDLKQLTTKEEKRIILDKLGVDYLVEFPFNERTAKTPPEEFVRRYLVSYLNAKLIVAGDDLSFGNKGLGNFELLESLKAELGYETRVISKVKYNSEIISSTLVRSYIENGKVDYATELIGAPYTISGIITHGNHIGTGIGFPTVNVSIPSEKLLPPFGVYYSNVIFEGRVCHGITNIGKKPTVNNTDVVNSETYIYDFDEDVYGQHISVEILKFERPEMKFNGLDELKSQLANDIRQGEQFFNINC